MERSVNTGPSTSIHRRPPKCQIKRAADNNPSNDVPKLHEQVPGRARVMAPLPPGRWTLDAGGGIRMEVHLNRSYLLI